MYSVTICLTICQGKGRVLLVLKSGRWRSDVAAMEIAPSSAVNSARLVIARSVCLASDDALRRGSEAELYNLTDSARLGTSVSNSRKKSDGTSQKTTRTAKVPTSSILSGECEKTRVVHVM
ncbi:hypothetical protein RRF57_011839 [Xylaria bambusicola]|uniref:Uncharacterized protein n=1 Tax=Xylaria bambusicola TaxID=326684 RepID=A0AAN7ZA95_9PEZI